MSIENSSRSKCFMSDKIYVGIYDIGLIRKRIGELHLDQIQIFFEK